MDYNFNVDEETIDRTDWIEKVYYEDGVKITRYKPVWWKEGLSKTTVCLLYTSPSPRDRG